MSPHDPATPSGATPSGATPSDATPSDATPSDATPSDEDEPTSTGPAPDADRAQPPSAPAPPTDAPTHGPTDAPTEGSPTVDAATVDQAPAGEPLTGEVPGGATAGGATAAGVRAEEPPTAETPGGGTAGAAAAGAGTSGAWGWPDPSLGGAGGAGAPPGGWVPPAGGTWGSFAGRRLARSSQRKVLAGVAGGLGEYTGIDPVLFRVLFAVLTLFGGSGILLYIVGWLFLPADDQEVSPAESLIHRGTGNPTRARDAVAAGALVVGGLVLAGVLALGDARDLALVLLVVGGAFFLIRNLPERRAGGPPPVLPEPPPAAPYETPLPAYQPAPVYQPSAATVTLPPPLLPDPAPPPPSRSASILGVLTLSLLLLVLGVAAALDGAGVINPEPDDLLALTVGTLGVGLLVGTWFGRARWLAWLGFPLLAALIVVSTSGVSLKGGAGDRRYAPLRASEISSEYRVGVGSLRLDLTDVDLSDRLVRTKLSAGVGNVEVIVPRDADVSVDGRAGIGEVELFGTTDNGTSVHRSVVDQGPTGDGSIDLTLDLDVNIGRVEVDRAPA